MKQSYRRTLVLVGGLIGLTCLAMAYSGKAGSPPVGLTSHPHPKTPATSGGVRLATQLVQDKIHMGGDGTVSVALTLAADPRPDANEEARRPLDLVVVLDRSGSMAEEGKLRHAAQAILGLLSRLSETDRFALVSYSDQVQQHGGLMPLTPTNRTMLEAAVRSILPNGSTNLGAGLQEGIQLLTSTERNGRNTRVILISDGLANRGVTDPAALGSMASAGAERGLGVSTIGVGLDFNEHLMTAIADKGCGNHTFMESPAAFAQVFEAELRSSKAVVASSVEVHLPLGPGISLVHAAGYPIEMRDGFAVLRPGDLLSGQSRKLFLTYRLPTADEKTWVIGTPRDRKSVV